jgi:hypothetical protein
MSPPKYVRNRLEASIFAMLLWPGEPGGSNATV